MQTHFWMNTDPIPVIVLHQELEACTPAYEMHCYTSHTRPLCNRHFAPRVLKLGFAASLQFISTLRLPAHGGAAGGATGLTTG
jgi:hypothetical protein